MTIKEVLPWQPVHYSPEQVAAIKCVANGTATPAQQIKCMQFIINEIAGYYDLSFRHEAAGGDRGTCFFEGRRYVGQQIVKMINLILPVAGQTNGREQPGS